MPEKSYSFRYFMHEREAEDAYQSLLMRGHTAPDISIVMAQTTHDRYRKSELLNAASFLHGPEIFLRWPDEEYLDWKLAEEESRCLRRELCSGGVLMIVASRNWYDTIFLDNLWGNTGQVNARVPFQTAQQ